MEKSNFESNMKELEKIVKELENGEIPLDDAIEKYTKAMKLASVCNDKLKSANENVNKILSDNGKLEDFNIPE